MIFVDADAYIAISRGSDALHLSAIEKLKKFSATEELLVTSWDVIDEVTTKLSFYVSRSLAKRFLDSIFSSNTRIEFVKPESICDIHKIFKLQKSKRVSLTDCTNMIIAKDLGIMTFFSFDHHYEQNGFKLF